MKVSLSKEDVKKQKKWSSIEKDKKKQKGWSPKSQLKAMSYFFLQTDFCMIINHPSHHTTAMVLGLELTRSDPVPFPIYSLDQYLNTDFLTEHTWVLWHLPSQNKLLFLRLNLLHPVVFCCPSNFFFPHHWLETFNADFLTVSETYYFSSVIRSKCSPCLELTFLLLDFIHFSRLRSSFTFMKYCQGSVFCLQINGQ